MTRVAIDLACNDPDNGNFAGVIEAVNFYAEGELVELSLNAGKPMALRWGGAVIFVRGKRWPILGIKGWMGNWCWDRVWMREDVAIAFLVWLQRSRKYGCECAPCDLFDAWNAQPCDLSEERLRRVLTASFAKQEAA